MTENVDERALLPLLVPDSAGLLENIRSNSGTPRTAGLSDSVIADFCRRDSSLGRAIEEAHSVHVSLRDEVGAATLLLDEADLVEKLQADYINFYKPETVNPYVALAARGPWIVTCHGRVLHDNGGYGMLGSGHGPDAIIEAMSQNWVMANVMTPSFSQKRLADALRREVGHTRGGCPFSHFVCLNSGSEAVTIGMRIADVNAHQMTTEGGRHEGKPIKLLSLKQSFHGRTQRPALISDSCKGPYNANLASFRNRDHILTVEANNIAALQAIFARADDEGFFIELMAMEPIQGEGSPGSCITREFYDEARRLTKEHGSLLLVDSIQAGLRGQGCLSVVDYRGFQDAEVPDLETWSKALNAGQFPLSVIGLSERAADLYIVGVYGNTMTTNPRALETAIAVLHRVTPEMRANIVAMGDEFLAGLKALQADYPDCIPLVQGTGLLLCVELDEDRFPVVGFGKVEEWCRERGLGVIHGGKNALRFTPHFGVNSAEIDLILSVVRNCLDHFIALEEQAAIEAAV